MVATESYIGHKVTAVVIAAGPLIFGVESNSLLDRIGLSLCSAIGAMIAISTDKPVSHRDAVIRVGASLFAGFLFGEILCQRFGTWVAGDKISVYGATGIVAWYVAGSVMRLLKGGLIDKWLAKKVGEDAPAQPPA